MKVLNLLRRTMHGTSTEAKKRVLSVRPECGLSTHRGTSRPLSCPLGMFQVGWDGSNQKWSKSYEEARRELNWPSIRDHHIFLTFGQLFKVIHSLDCIKFDSHFSCLSRPSRSHNQNPCCVPSRLNCYRLSFLSMLPSCGKVYLPKLLVLNPTYYSSVACTFI